MKLNFFASLFLTSIVLAVGLAHLLSLPNKIVLSNEEYIVAQRAYDNWSLASIIILCAIVSTFLQAIRLRGRRDVFVPAVIATICLVIALVIFWLFTFPANQQTHNWTTLPVNWIDIRNKWEYSQAAAAIFELIALVMVIISVLNKKSYRSLH